VVSTFAGLLLPLLAPGKNHALGRRVFWVGLTVALVSAFFIAYPPDWKSGVGLSLFVTAMMLMTAYFTSPYLKFGGKVAAFFTTDAEAEERTGGNGEADDGPRGGRAAPDGALTSARKLWWLMVLAMALCAFNIGQYVAAGDNPRLAIAVAAAIVVVSIVLGYGDGRANFSVARRQSLQFAIVSIVSLGALTVLYLGAYAVGKQWWRRHQERTQHA
jgi:hypothetical protein